MAGTPKTPPQLIAQEFFATQDIAIPELSTPVTPATDIAYVRELNLFFLRRTSPAHHWAPFPIPEYAPYPTLHQLLLAYIRETYTSIPMTPQTLSSFTGLLGFFCPTKFPNTANAHQISFTNNVSFSFAHKTLVPTDPHKDFTLLALPFSSSEFDTPTPLFDSFVAHAFPEDPTSFRTYLLEIIGYLLLPPYLARNPACFYLYGETGTGKSVFLDIIEAIFPDYLKSALSLSDLTNSQFKLADLAGKLINIVDEDESEYVNGGKLKALTSMRPITAERKYEQSFRFTPQAKFIFSSNHFPTLKNLDSAIERRLHIIPFEHRVPEDKIIRDLAERIVQNELPGIIGQALNAALAFLDNNLKFSIPEKAHEARQTFMTESSSPLTFFDACYQVSPTHQTTNDTLYEDYLLYCRKYQRQALSSLKFHQALKQIPGLVTLRGAHGKRAKNCVKRLDAPLLNV